MGRGDCVVSSAERLPVPSWPLCQPFTTLELAPQLLHGTSQLSPEALAPEAFSVAGADLGSKCGPVRFEEFNRFCQSIPSLIIEKYPCGIRSGPSVNDLRGPTCTVAYYGTSCCLSFYAGDAEIFISGGNEGFGPLQVIRYYLIALVAQQLHIRSCYALSSTKLWSLPNDD